MTVGSFEDFVAVATGGKMSPYRYQVRLADEGFPDVLRVPTGTGKTLAAVLPWMYRRQVHPDTTPRWLVFVVPQRVLVEQTLGKVREWVERVELPISVHVLMGGEDSETWEWMSGPVRDRVFVGTQDMVLSRLLMRGFGEARSSWPRSFGLLHAGVQFVFDEVQLMGPGLPTSLQLQGLRDSFGAALPCRSMWMSATLDPQRLRTPDFTRELSVVELGDDDSDEGLRKLLDARKTVAEVRLGDPDGRRYPRELAKRVLAEHRAGTRTLVVVNTVDRAAAMFAELRGAAPAARLVLLHARFRPGDREHHVEAALAEPGGAGTIVVSTQVLEAGVDVTSETLVTEAAPWSSLVQRAGRCNRDGKASEARLLWVVPPRSRDMYLPYDSGDVDATVDQLRSLEGHGLTGPQLAAQDVLERDQLHPVLRRRDLIDLFDTAPDLSGNDIDVSPFIRDTIDRTVPVAWRDLSGDGWTAMPAPRREELCPAPVGAVKRVVSAGTSVVLDQRDGDWRIAREDDVRPTALLVLDAARGGYTSQTGFDPRSTSPVDPVEPAEDRQRSGPDGLDRDPESGGRAWTGLAEHLADTEHAARVLLDGLNPDLGQDLREAIALGARYHDLGKAHPTFIASLDKANPDTPPPATATVWAKSPSRTPLRHDPRHFRHELVSALLLLDPDTGLLDGVAERDLVVYLALAHHGKARLTVRAVEDEPRDTVLGVREGSVTAATDLPGTRLEERTLSLAATHLGVGSLTDRALRLRDRKDLGPFRLAFCEALVRAADGRASDKDGV
ncbi:CRISPR-associated Cas3 family helicase [Amycolatopsis sulphurea]|uniref:CRISPR-associated Cas3 family helicase n=1 Tax=Amycolatopsis sulphurea TaxID=76022 RepID=A0A2A9FFM0_9PSEU|nr:CRISPR-associated helicase Cas3' [Amycolatopsis sulphurea]PFG50174.1 CRISPR-associated Cas3 family helicase [Amycolatopsis sulphurea]